jgi:hypothetical protein
MVTPLVENSKVKVPPWFDQFLEKQDMSGIQDADPAKFAKELEAYGVTNLREETNQFFGTIYAVDHSGVTERWSPTAMKFLVLFARIYDYNINNSEAPAEEIMREIQGWGMQVLGTLRLGNRQEYTMTQFEVDDMLEKRTYDPRRYM